MLGPALPGWTCGAVLALLAAPAAAQNIGDYGYRHAENHAWYSRTFPAACCHDGDCRETLAKYTPTGWVALVDGDWMPVPQHALLRERDGSPRASPDQRAHVCASKLTKTIFCFLPPGYES